MRNTIAMEGIADRLLTKRFAPGGIYEQLFVMHVAYVRMFPATGRAFIAKHPTSTK